MDKETQAALLIATFEDSLDKGYRFSNLKGQPLLTVENIIVALLEDEIINVVEPDAEYSPTLHRGKVN